MTLTDDLPDAPVWKRYWRGRDVRVSGAPIKALLNPSTPYYRMMPRGLRRCPQSDTLLFREVTASQVANVIFFHSGVRLVNWRIILNRFSPAAIPVYSNAHLNNPPGYISFVDNLSRFIRYSIYFIVFSVSLVSQFDLWE